MRQLAALRTFFEYSGQRSRERLGQAQKVAAIPRKRAQPPETIFLERDEIEATLAALPTGGRHALRDRALLVFLYNTGARVQEAADLRANDVHFNPTPRAHLHGKGDKWRVCPLWTETAALLNRLLTEQGSASAPDRPIFTGATDAALTRFGTYKIIRRYTAQVVKERSDGRSRPVSPGAWLGSVLSNPSHFGRRHWFAAHKPIQYSLVQRIAKLDYDVIDLLGEIRTLNQPETKLRVLSGPMSFSQRNQVRSVEGRDYSFGWVFHPLKPSCAVFY